MEKEIDFDEEDFDEEELKNTIRKMLVQDFENDLKTMPNEMRLFTENECPNCLRLKGSKNNYFFELDELKKILTTNVLVKLFKMTDSQFKKVKKCATSDFENFFKLGIWGGWADDNRIQYIAKKNLIVDIMNVIRDYWKEKEIKTPSKISIGTFSYYFDTSYYDGDSDENSDWDGMYDYIEPDDYLEPSPDVDYAYDESYFLEDFYLYIKLVDKKNNSEIHFLFNIDIDNIYDCCYAQVKLLYSIIK